MVSHLQGAMLSLRSHPRRPETKLRNDPLLESFLHFLLGNDAALLDILETFSYLLEDVEVILNILERGTSGRPWTNSRTSCFMVRVLMYVP